MPVVIAPVLITAPVRVLLLICIPVGRPVGVVMIAPGLVLETLPVPPLTVEFSILMQLMELVLLLNGPAPSELPTSLMAQAA